MQFQVIFDRPDRLYRLGDAISGRVVLRPDSDCTYSQVWITYRWRTHGKGNRDQGEEQSLTLAKEKTSLKARELREIPFSFRAPDGPVSYHGVYLNVDWYLTAHALSGPFSHAKSEQDFLLLGGNPTGAVVLGTREIPLKDLPVGSTEMTPTSEDLLDVKPDSTRSWRRSFSRAGFVLGGSLATVLATVFVITFGGWLLNSLNWHFLLVIIIPIVILILLALGCIVVFRNAYKIKLEVRETRVRPESLYAGGQVSCHVDMVAKGGVHLQGMKATISAREHVTYNAGTSKATKNEVLDEKTYSRPFNEDLAEGRWISFECALPVGADAPPTFTSQNNKLEWTVMLKAELKGWPPWQKIFPITVLPALVAEGQYSSRISPPSESPG